MIVQNDEINRDTDRVPALENIIKYQVSKCIPLKERTDLTRPQSAKIRIIDRPCGTGKTTEIIGSFKPGTRYLVVVQLLSEVERVIRDASVAFCQPSNVDQSTKASHLELLLLEGRNVVTTHALFREISDMAERGLADNYHIIIDEVLDVVQSVPGPSATSYQEFYLDTGYVEQRDDGLVVPTLKWDATVDLVSDTLQTRLYRLAKARMLYRVDDTFFLWALPSSLLQAGRSFTVYTYMAEGSLMLAYLKKLGIPFVHQKWQWEGSFRTKVRSLLDIRGIPALEDPRKGIRLSHTGQTCSQGKAERDRIVSQALRKLRERHLSSVPLSDVILTCAKENWFKNGRDDRGKPGGFSKDSRMFNAIWLPNTTRGTNDYAHASVAIYLYDQHLNPGLARWLGMTGPEANDRYALAELIQWVFRSRIRRGKPVVLYLPSKRMRSLLVHWLDTGEVTREAPQFQLAG